MVYGEGQAKLLLTWCLWPREQWIKRNQLCPDGSLAFTQLLYAIYCYMKCRSYLCKNGITTLRNKNETENSIMISFLDKSTHLFSLVPIWHLSACIKHFYTAIKIQFCIQLCENNCHIADCFSLCYFIFTIIFNDCVSLSIDLPSLPCPLLLDIRVFCLFFVFCFFGIFLLVFYSYYEKTVFVARAGKMAHWVKVVVAKTDLWLMA